MNRKKWMEKTFKKIDAKDWDYTKTISYEAVGIGHPDKICDRIAESILGLILTFDNTARVAIEVIYVGNLVKIFGEVSTTINKAQWISRIKDIIIEITKNPNVKIDTQDIRCQSNEIKQKAKLGAGDNAIVWGYSHLPPQQKFLQDFMKFLGECDIIFTKDDAKIIWTETEKRNKRFVKLTLCQQVEKNLSILEEINLENSLKSMIIHFLDIRSVLKRSGEFEGKKIQIEFKLITFVKGGSDADSGLTGRKLMCETYGQNLPHGGGSLAGKDLTKPDKGLAFFARLIATEISRELPNNPEVSVGISAHIGQQSNWDFNIQTTTTSRKDWVKIKKLLELYHHMTYEFIYDFFSAPLNSSQYVNHNVWENFAKGGYFHKFHKAWMEWRKIYLDVVCQNKQQK